MAPERVVEQEPVVEVGPASLAVEAPGRAQVALVAGVISVAAEQELALEAGGLEPAGVALGQALVAVVQVAVGMEVVQQERELEALGQDLVAAVQVAVGMAAEEQEREEEALELAGELELPAGKPRHRENG